MCFCSLRFCYSFTAFLLLSVPPWNVARPLLGGALLPCHRAVSTGKPGLMWRLLGSVDTDEVREMKVADIDQQLADTEKQIQQHTEQLKWVGATHLSCYSDEY